MACKAPQADIFRIARLKKLCDLYRSGVRQLSALRLCRMEKTAGDDLNGMPMLDEELRKIEKAVVVTAGEITAEM